MENNDQSRPPYEDDGIDRLIDGLLSIEQRFGLLDVDYKIQAPERKGELCLRDIASDSEREYEWVFNKSSCIWKYVVNNNYSSNIDARTGRVVSYGLTMSKELEYSKKAGDIYYHIHPYSDEKEADQTECDKKYYDVLNQLPSPTDIGSFIGSDYSRYRIVSKLGVTEVIIDYPKLYDLIDNPKTSRDEHGNINTLDISLPLKSMLLELIDEKGEENTLHLLFSDMSNKSGGVITYSFRAFNEENR